mmetsp:Transcript_18491/g.25443  ORF Transcript_18491/g.25443 Transcript_18491/m.25443 type:complete len:101 (-) Transcript_18491:90-392(-)|eukprot:CAMPEP_0185728840 /NCGR_PEP_ID=MMETSP1171-20130828/4251_1 /TAXON_ID=374046 /ORGANISM="Helicotheca tamensis, Strain CCMP826" /LENGTH=100 /DNA_ID=CAMNT_0028397589 /DNA_START=121 /DNA_END=423 /DNA_ORIENTATION=+
MCSDAGQASRICAFYSFTGILFTLWVALLLTYQPFFIAGIEDEDTAIKSAWGAMATFIVTFIISLIGIQRDSQNKIQEPDTPEGYSLNPGGATEYGSRYD